jgi:hypothetical protein
MADAASAAPEWQARNVRWRVRVILASSPLARGGGGQLCSRQQRLKVISRWINITEDLGKQARSKRVPGMNRDHSGPSIGMPNEMVASFHPQHIKVSLPERHNDRFACMRRLASQRVV